MEPTSEELGKAKSRKAKERIITMNGDGTKTLRIPSKFKVGAATLNANEKDSTTVFGGTFQYIYKQDIFLNQVTQLFKHFFSVTLSPKEVTITEQIENMIQYIIPNYVISSYELTYLNEKLQNLREKDETDYYPGKEPLYDHIKNIYQDPTSLILISRQKNKEKNGEIQIVNEYTYFEKRDIHHLLKQMEKNNHLYEVIAGEYEMKPFFDLDAEDYEKLNTEENQKAKLDLFIDFLKSEIKQIYEIHLEDSDFVILDSCTPVKLSYHIVINNKVKFENMTRHKEFAKYLRLRVNNPMHEEEMNLFKNFKWTYKSEKGSEERTIFDTQVYRSFGCLRLVNQSKKGKKQQLELITGHKMEDTFVQYDNKASSKMYLETSKLSRYYEEEMENVKKTKTRERRPIRELKAKKDKDGNEVEEKFDFHINFKKEGITLQTFKNMSDIDLMKLEPEYYRYLHTLPIQDSYEEWIKVGMALKSCKAPETNWDEWSQLGMKYRRGECEEKYGSFLTEDENPMGFSIRTLKCLANKCKPSIFKGFLPIYNIMYELNTNGMECIEEDCHYLSQEGTPHERNIFTDKHTLILHASMGAGKTTAITRMLKEYNYGSCLFFSTRQTFAHFVAGEFRDFHNYLNKDDEDINQKDKIIMSLESLHKISEFKRYEMVVCDEMETLLSNFSSSTLGPRTYETFQRFENLLKGAKKVVMMDAFISNRTIHLAKGLTKRRNIRYLRNVAERKQVVAREMSYKRDISFGTILEHILSGKKLYIMFSSNKKLNEFLEYLGTKKDNRTILNDEFMQKMLIYNRDTDKEMMKGLMEINKTWKEASCIIASPKITVGCSYNPEGDTSDPTFDMKINLAIHSCTARDAFQSLMRVRNVGEDGLVFAIGPSAFTNFEKNFLYLNLFNDYENEKRDNIIKSLKERVTERQANNDICGRKDECKDLNTLIQYLEKNEPIPMLREILYYNSLEMNMSSRYFKEYYMTLLPQSGFKYIEGEKIPEDEQQPDPEEINLPKKPISEVVEAYKKIPQVTTPELEKLEKKQKKNDSTKEENEMISKFYFERMINVEKTPEEAVAKMFYDLWMDRTKKKIILHNYHYAKSYHAVLKKEIEETLCTEKMENLAEKHVVLKEIEKELDVEHGDEKTVITIEKVSKCYEYLRKNHKKIHDKVFKMRDQSKKNGDEEFDEDQKVKYVITFLNKIYKNFYGYALRVCETDGHTKYPLSYIFLPTESLKYEYMWKKEDIQKYLFEEDE